jgi:hypothetical protein
MNWLNIIGFLDKKVLFSGSIKEYAALSSELSGYFRLGYLSRKKTGLYEIRDWRGEIVSILVFVLAGLFSTNYCSKQTDGTDRIDGRD